MKPKAQSDQDDGMLEFLEDIVGTSQHKEPIEVLAKKVDELNDIRGEKVPALFLGFPWCAHV